LPSPHAFPTRRSSDLTLRCMRTLNADASADGTVIRGCNLVDGFEEPPPEIMDCGESGSTLRFLIPVALALQGGGKFTGHGRLMEDRMSTRLNSSHVST